MTFNPLTCEGWSETSGWVAASPCMKARLGFVILFFITALIRKWGGEEIGLPFNFLFSLVGGMLPYLLIIIIFGSFKAAFVIGIIGMLLGGYGGGIIFGGSEGGYE